MPGRSKRLRIQGLLKHVPPDHIPASQDLFSSRDLAAYLDALDDPPLSLVAVGDILLGDHASRTIASKGTAYPFRAVDPLLRRAPIVLGNLEGPLTRESGDDSRRYSYKVGPEMAEALRHAGFNVLNLANNHALDCGTAGLVETFDALRVAGIAVIGAGRNEQAAHAPFIGRAGPWRVGFLGYYWHRRCAATPDQPGAAMDSPEALRADIAGLRNKVDRIVATFHWGVPYDREPGELFRAEARFAVECGADVVVGHHPHIIQPMEVHQGRPIFYSVGNFTFGSRNSKAEGLLLGVRFEETSTVVHLYPLYVKNRDPRVNYQPKVLRGDAAERVLRHLAEMSGAMGTCLHIENGRGSIQLDRVQPSS